MDWNLFLLSLATVFISELGDKSQIAAVALGGTSRFPVAVFLGTASALVLTSGLGVILGEGSAALLPTVWIKGAAAIGFAILGGRLLWDSFFPEPENLDIQSLDVQNFDAQSLDIQSPDVQNSHTR